MLTVLSACEGFDISFDFDAGHPYYGTLAGTVSRQRSERELEGTAFRQ
jgi:hypothetical protein